MGEQVPILSEILQHSPPDLMAERDACLSVRELKAVGIVQHLDPPHALRQFSGTRDDYS